MLHKINITINVSIYSKYGIENVVRRKKARPTHNFVVYIIILIISQ